MNRSRTHMGAATPQRFIVACPARTGSTMLVHLLRSHPDCVSHSEVLAFTDGLGGFDPKVKARLAARGEPEEMVAWRRRDPATFLNEVAFDSGGAPCVGVKIKSDELVQRSYRQLLEELRRSTDIKVLHLNRSNLLERYLSWVMVNKVTGVTMAVERSGVPAFEAVRINPKKAEKDFVEAERRAETMREWFRDHDVLEVDYETIVRHPDVESERMCDFLGLEQVPLTTPTLKITPHVSELISNYDEVEQYFAGTRFSSLFASPDDDAVVELQRRPPSGQSASRPEPEDLARPAARWMGTVRWWDHICAIADIADGSPVRVLGIDAATDLVPEEIAAIGDYVGIERNLDVVTWYRARGADRVEVTHAGPATQPTDRISSECDLVVVAAPAGAEPAPVDLLARCRRTVAGDGRLVMEVDPTTTSLDALTPALTAAGWELVGRVEARAGLGPHVVARPR